MQSRLREVKGTTQERYSVLRLSSIADEGHGNTGPDWEIVGAHHVRLRAERSGHGSGRIYTITIAATDSYGNASTQMVLVRVPRN